MEMSLARLADGGQLRKSFNFLRIKHALDIIAGKDMPLIFKNYPGYYYFFSFIGKFFDPYPGFNIILGTLAYLIQFTVEFRGMGNV